MSSNCAVSAPMCMPDPVCEEAPSVSLKIEAYNPCKKYGEGDGNVMYDNHLAQSLTDEPNGDNPLTGALKHPPTWKVVPLTDLVNLLSG